VTQTSEAVGLLFKTPGDDGRQRSSTVDHTRDLQLCVQRDGEAASRGSVGVSW